MKHEKYDPKVDKEFWSYSWQEMGDFDEPAQIDYILNFTNIQNLTFIGDS